MRALSVKEASRAPSNVDGVKFIARRNQHGLEVGDVTENVLGLPVTKAQRLMFHGIITCEPASNFKLWGKDVAPWLMKNHLEHPVTMADLIKTQVAMADDDVKALPISKDWLAMEKLKAEQEAKSKADAAEKAKADAVHAAEAEAHAKQREALAAQTAKKASSVPQDEEAEESQEHSEDAPEGEATEPVTKPRRRKQK